MGPLVEEVFKLNGIPTYTFVEPLEYDSLVVALRTPGRGVVIEGPSAIGKTTAVTRALDDLGMEAQTLRLSARVQADLEIIEGLPEMESIGTVIVDDFHRLEPALRERVADFMKTLADEERVDSKVVVVGINRVGETLIAFAKDLNTRIEVITLEANPAERVRELVTKGERALAVSLGIADEIVDASNGSFFIAQMLSHNTCIAAGIMEAQSPASTISISFESVRTRVMDVLDRRFRSVAASFAAGPRLRREGRAPYLHILRWLAEANEWSISLDREMASHPELKGSVGQIVDKGYLDAHIRNFPDVADVVHFEPPTKVVAVEDPQFVFYIRNLAWNEFAREVGFLNITFDSKYDFALSFSGTVRLVAERLFEILTEDEFEIFYDRHEQHRILAGDVEEYLAPIYRSEAAYVLVLLSPDYPERVWTKFESDQFRERFTSGSVIPIWWKDVPPAAFDLSRKVGGLTFDPAEDLEEQLQAIAGILRGRMAEDRVDPQLPLPGQG
jgi:hypothetical protein